MRKVYFSPQFLLIEWITCVLVAFFAGRAACTVSWCSPLIHLQQDAPSEPLLPRSRKSHIVELGSVTFRAPDTGGDSEAGLLYHQREGMASSSKQRAETLVHPALLTHEHPRRIAVLGEDVGLVVEEILKHRTVEHVEVFVPQCWHSRSFDSRVLYTLAEKVDLPHTLRHRSMVEGPFDVVVWNRNVASPSIDHSKSRSTGSVLDGATSFVDVLSKAGIQQIQRDAKSEQQDRGQY